MKKFFKLIPAALALVALASCSNDDLLNTEKPVVFGGGDLIVECDPLESGEGDATRAYRTADAKSLFFVETDKINVYDADLYKHDRYVFNGSSFVIDGKKYGIEPKYALFPSADVVRGYWDHETDMVNAEFAIPQVIRYDAESEKTMDGKKVYAANLPMFGYAATNGDGVKVSNLRYLVALLKIDVKNAYGNANYLRLTNSKKKPLTGTFVATLNPDPAKREKVFLKKGAADLISSEFLYIDLRNVPSENSIIFVPIIPGLDGDADGISLMYTHETGDDPTKFAASSWYETGCKFPMVEFTAHKLFEAGYTFSLGAETPDEISAILAQYAPTAESDIVLNIEKKFYTKTNGAGKVTENEFKIPATKAGVNIQINLDDKFAVANWDGADDISFVDADADKPFTGKITFNLKDKMSTSGKIKNITVNLPKADVVLAGDFNNTATMFLTKAKTVSLGDGATTTTIKNLTNTTKSVANVGTLTIASKATVTNYLYTNHQNTNVIVSGQVVGSIDMTKSTKGKLTLNSGLDNETDKVVSTYVAVKGDIDIALTKPAVAAQQVYMYGAKHTATLTGGFVGLLMNVVDNAGVWEDKDVNLVLGGEVPSAILNLNMSKGPINISGATKWNGKKITNTTFADKKTSVWDGSATDANGVLTAAQLATLSKLSDMNFYADIDLNNKDWTSIPAGIAKINGKNKTISNLKKNPLFADLTQNLDLKDLTIAGADLDGGYYKGALAGEAYLVDLNIENVKVTGLKINVATSMGAPAAAYYNGGIIGFVSASGKTIKFKKVSASGEIDCSYYTGGLVGYLSSGDVTFDTCTSNVTIKQTYDSGKSMGLDFARIGGFVGSMYQSSSSDKVAITGSTTAPTHAWAKKEFHSDTSYSSGDFFLYTAQQDFIGFSGAGSSSSPKRISDLKINGTSYGVPSFGTADGGLAPGQKPVYDFTKKKEI